MTHADRPQMQKTIERKNDAAESQDRLIYDSCSVIIVFLLLLFSVSEDSADLSVKHTLGTKPLLKVVQPKYTGNYQALFWLYSS
jgi:hypothetical protein